MQNTRDAPPVKQPMSMGLLPKFTGLPCVLWLHRRRGDRLPFAEATPDIRYDRAIALTFYLEPTVICPDPDADPDTSYEVGEFLGENLKPVMDYWDGVIIDPRKVVEEIRKPKYTRS